ncbi:unnamed protein product [Prorocentrum cordatum]|uniref:Uncharacterized protein n=1 Tax=Prorocentrum cordatum TaxID=2364126 RepID=A0ABN9PH63_9DINO|nr:unnamed protein product [Polarella glacialis]
MYWTAMLAARRGSPTLLAIIRQIVSNVQARYYGPPRGVDHADLYITGRGMLTEVLRRETPRGLRSSCRLHVSQMWKVNIPESKVRETTGRKRVIAEVDEDVHRAMRSCDNCDSYGSLFQRHQVYCSERGPRCQFSVTPLPPAERYASLVVS